ncbi:2-succinyl-6-hydroxy-2,4-cyclohexadiene-1-carboxylate synthase [Fictibacillus halophilus]|uniref:2-succinyl-6-hydroxy-2, 4-cyclohexadiene-1-carboxylate synthase n=1 Tax=Fictibacillus halophilus TaxID=1610490 RepID=A0ABV2LKR7_9BACL|nr:alpha/beta hydrolase [Fictibacillus halophilus]
MNMNIPFDEHKIQSHDGTILTGYDYGGSGNPLILIHYLGGTAKAWNPVIPFFRSHYRIISYDLRGHGKSEQPHQGYSFEDTANDLESVMNHFEIEKAHLVGSSYGCMIGLYFTAMRQGRVSSLANIDGAIINDSGEHGLHDETLEEHLAKFKGQLDPDYESVEEFQQVYQEQWLPWNKERANYVAEYEPRMKENGKVGNITTGQTMEKIISEIYYVDFLTWYKKVRSPVLFLPAEKEEHFQKSLNFIDLAKKELPYSETVVIPNTTHLMMFDHGKELAEAILKFHSELPVSEKSIR